LACRETTGTQELKNLNYCNGFFIFSRKLTNHNKTTQKNSRVCFSGINKKVLGCKEMRLGQYLSDSANSVQAPSKPSQLP
jgi:hypothetical protein